MNILEVFKNEFLHKLGLDHIAVDANGVPIARASDRASVERAAPNAAAYFSGADFAAPEAPAVAETTKPVEYFPAPPPELAAPVVAPVVAPSPVDAVIPPAPPQDNDHIEPGSEQFPEPVAADAPPDPNLPTTPYPELSGPAAIVPSDEQSQTANQAPDAPAGIISGIDLAAGPDFSAVFPVEAAAPVIVDTPAETETPVSEEAAPEAPVDPTTLN